MYHKSLRKFTLGILLVFLSTLGDSSSVLVHDEEDVHYFTRVANSYSRKMEPGGMSKASINEGNEKKLKAYLKIAASYHQENNMNHLDPKTLIYDQKPEENRAAKVERQRLLVEETKELVALMHRDYKGMNRPKRKPPINNHMPIH